MDLIILLATLPRFTEGRRRGALIIILSESVCIPSQAKSDIFPCCQVSEVGAVLNAQAPAGDAAASLLTLYLGNRAIMTTDEVLMEDTDDEWVRLEA